MSHAPFCIKIQHRLLVAMLELASTDDTRYILNDLCLEVHPDQTRLIATDGRRMGVLLLRLHHNCVYNYDEASALVQANDGKPVRLILSRELIEDAAPKQKRRWVEDDCNIFLTIHDPLTTMFGTHHTRRIEAESEGRPKMIFSVTMATYPDYAKALPTAAIAPAAALTFNPELTVAFSAVAEALRAKGANSIVLRSHVNADDNSSYRALRGHIGVDVFSVFIVGVPEFYGVLMPVRFSEEDARPTMETPSWLHARRHIPPYQPRRIEPAAYRQRHQLRVARLAERRPARAS